MPAGVIPPTILPRGRDEPQWQGGPLDSWVLSFLTQKRIFGAGGQVKQKFWRYDVDSDIRAWTWPPQSCETLYLLTAGGAPRRPRQWRWDYDPPSFWLADPIPTNIRTFPSVAPFSRLWRYDYAPDQPWPAAPTPSDTLFQLTANGAPTKPWQWRWDHVPDPAWLWEAPPDWTLVLPTPKPFAALWRYDYVPDQVWLGEPQPINIRTFPVTATPFNKLWRWDFVPDPVWQGTPVSSNIEALPVTPTLMGAAGIILDVQFDAVWQGVPVGTNIDTLPVSAKPFNKLWRWDFVPDAVWVWEAPPDWSLLLPSTAPFSKLWRWDYTPEPAWKGSPLGSYTLLDLTAGGKPFLKLWRYDVTPSPDWLGEPYSTNIGTFPVVVKPFSNEWAQYLYVPPSDWTWNAPPVFPGRIPGPPAATPQTQFWAPSPPVKTEWQWSPPYNIELSSPVAPQAPFSKQWRYDYVPEPFWVWEPPPDWTLRTPTTAPFSKQWRWDYQPEPAWTWDGSSDWSLFIPAVKPFGKLWRWDYQQDAPWVGAPVSVNIETFPAAGTSFSRLWRYDLTPSPDWTWQPPASGILQALTAGGAPTHLQWRYDYTPEPVWRGTPVSASYAALKESGKPFGMLWRYDWDSGRSWWQGAPIGVNVPIANPGPPIPVPPTTGTGGGERWPPGYRWRWTDFNDRAWLKAFRDEFYRLRRLKNPERRRAQFEVLEQKFIGAAERVLEYETPYEKKLDLVQLGEMLQGFAAPASFDRIEMYLVALAAEIDDEEAFLLLND